MVVHSFSHAMAPYAAEFQPELRPPSLSLSGSSLSSSMDTDSDYEAQLAQGVLHLAPLPVLLPQRPSSPYDQALPNILHEVTGADDLKSVLELKLKVLSSELSLSKVHLYVPQLVTLDLSGSFLHSLRDLGCNFSNLKLLKVDRCSLDSLDGVLGLSSLVELSAAYNRIEDLSPAIYLEHLKILNLRGNSISDLSFLEFLNNLPLEDLTLADNPASRATDGDEYSQSVLNTLPRLKFFDGSPVLQESPTAFTADRLPSLWAVKIRPSSPREAVPLTPARPQSARPDRAGPLVKKPFRRASMSDIFQESLSFQELPSGPDKLCPVSRLTSGGIVCGNLANALRQRKKKPRPAERATRENEEEVLTIVDVDVDESLGQTSAVSASSFSRRDPSSFSDSSERTAIDCSIGTLAGSSNGLITAARRWRKAFVLFQERSWDSWQKHSIDIKDDASEEDYDNEWDIDDDNDTTEVSK